MPRLALMTSISSSTNYFSHQKGRRTERKGWVGEWCAYTASWQMCVSECVQSKITFSLLIFPCPPFLPFGVCVDMFCKNANFGGGGSKDGGSVKQMHAQASPLDICCRIHSLTGDAKTKSLFCRQNFSLFNYDELLLGVWRKNISEISWGTLTATFGLNIITHFDARPISLTQY